MNLRDWIHELADHLDPNVGVPLGSAFPETFTALIRVIDYLDSIEHENSEYWQIAFEIRREIQEGLEGC